MSHAKLSSGSSTQGQIHPLGASASRQARRDTTIPSAAAAATEELQQAPVAAGAVKGLGFYTGEDGYIYCDDMRVDDVRQQVADSPFYLYSRDRITANYQAYATVGAAKAHLNMYLCLRMLMRVHHYQGLPVSAKMVKAYCCVAG